MTLPPGTRLGPYEIVALVGAGGMGEVYRAHDARLRRDVAIKSLPASVAADPERLARFEREAQMLAALSHTHIAAVYGIENVGTAPCLVMEFVEGPTLAELIASTSGKGLPIAEALPLACQIADALEAAHERGIIHRDLKPANIKVTTRAGADFGSVKVLDFGLAKAMDPIGSPPGVSGPASRSQSPTLTTPAMTQMGAILGTAAYMSPEQAKGRAVSKQADIWAFGVVLWEMLTGRPLFTGESVTEVLASVLKGDPDWDSLPTATPPGVRRVLRRCLAKSPSDRLRDVGDISLMLRDADEVADRDDTKLQPGDRRLGHLWPWAITVLLLIGWVATAIFLPRRTTGESPGVRASIVLPDPIGIPTQLYETSASLATIALSPSGEQIAFIGYENGEGSLFVRRLDSFDAVRLPNTQGATAPFFSPDGKRLAFFSRGHLKRIDLPGGVPVDLGPSSPNSEGGSWGDDGQIVFTPGYAEAIWRIPADGGEARPLTKVDRSAGEASHRWPCALPGGAGVLFTIKSATDESLDDAHIAIADIKTGEHRVLIEGGSMPRYLADGHLVFARAGRLFVVGFDLASRTIRGAPVAGLDGVITSGMTGSAFYDVTMGGMLAYLPGGMVVASTRMSWEGPNRPAEEFETLYSAGFGNVQLSADYRRAVVGVGAANDKLWLVDLDQVNVSRLTGGPGNDGVGVLTPDGRWLLFTSDRAGGGYRFYRMPLDGRTPPEPLVEGEGSIDSISYPARMLGITLASERDRSDAYAMAVSDDGAPAGKPILVAGGPFDQFEPAVSPDGALVAYTSSESGRSEVYVVRLAEPGSRRRLTRDGGRSARWNREGNRLFYTAGDGLYSVVLSSASDLRFGDPQRVAVSRNPGVIISYDVAPDGASVLLLRTDDPLQLRREIRIWPDWGTTVRSLR